MGWTVLYIAFGIVALWLLGEVLLQYKARLRWRLLAFAGFSFVVLGVLLPSVLVIVAGAVAFAAGQTQVTLSFRRGFSTGWAIGGSPGASRRRRPAPGRAKPEPTLQVSDLETEYEPAGDSAHPGGGGPEYGGARTNVVYAPEPLPDETGQYAVYSDAARQARAQQFDEAGDAQQFQDASDAQQFPQGPGAQPFQDDGQQARDAGYDPYSAQDQHAYTGQDAYTGQEAYTGQDAYTGGYDYGTDQQQYAAYSDPYIGTGTTAGAPRYTSYDSYGNGYDGYQGQQGYAQDPYAEQYASDTPPGGVWVPQQRESEPVPTPPEQQPAPYPDSGYDPGHDEQRHRY